MAKLRKRSNVADYVIVIIVNIILLFVVNKLPSWNISWLKDSVIGVIILFELSYVVQILGYMILIINDRHLLKQIVKILQNAASLFPMYVLYVLFPFDFSRINAPAWTDMLVRIFIILSMIGLIIAIVVEIVKIFQPQDFESSKIA